MTDAVVACRAPLYHSFLLNDLFAGYSVRILFLLTAFFLVAASFPGFALPCVCATPGKVRVQTNVMVQSKVLVQTSRNDETSAQQKLDSKIDALIAQLESPKFQERQRATKELWQLGSAAEKKLRSALNSTNAEVAARAQSILADFDYGIYPNTPADIKASILAFRDGNEQQKLKSGTRLLETGRVETLIKLILKESRQDRIQFVIDDLFGNSDFVDRMLKAKQADRAVAALRLLNQKAFELGLGATRQEQLRAEYLWLSAIMGQLDSEVSQVAEALGDPGQLTEHFFYLRCLRANGQFEKSKQVARSFENQKFAQKMERLILLENHQWNQLSDSYWIEDRHSISELDVPNLLNGLTCHRLAHQDERFQRDLKLLYEFSDELVDDLALDANSGLFERVTNSTIFMICEFLFANHQTEKALEYLFKTDKLKAFAGYVSVDDHQRAFASIGFQDISPATAAILDRQIRTYKPSRWADSTTDIEQLAEIIYAFYQLGFYEEALGLYRTLYSVAARYETTQTGALAAVGRSLLSNDQKDLFFELIRPQVLQNKYDFAVKTLFSEIEGQVDGVSVAQYWLTVFEMERDDLKPIERLRLLDRVLRPIPPGQKPDPMMVKLIQKIADELETETDSWGDEAFLGYTYLLWNDRENAKKWFEKYDNPGIGMNDIGLILGDLYREDKQFELAHNAYLKSWKSPGKSILGLYLAGLSKRLGGDEKPAVKLIGLANRLMLRADDHREVATGLYARGLSDEARQLLETAMKVADFQSWELGTTRFRLINILSENESKRAANLLENQLVDVGATGRYYPSMSSYTYYPVEAQLRRFNQCLTQNDPRGAYEAARTALTIRPCSATIAEDYLPRLRKLTGGAELADELFESIREAYKKRLQQFPKSGLYNNNLAWINTTNKKHLEEALTLAEKVVQNEPDNPTYLDTLADVCFNLGQVDRAIEIMEKCLRLNPRSEHYNIQIKRFRAQQQKANKTGN